MKKEINIKKVSTLKSKFAIVLLVIVGISFTLQYTPIVKIYVANFMISLIVKNMWNLVFLSGLLWFAQKYERKIFEERNKDRIGEEKEKGGSSRYE